MTMELVSGRVSRVGGKIAAARAPRGDCRFETWDAAPQVKAGFESHGSREFKN